MHLWLPDVGPWSVETWAAGKERIYLPNYLNSNIDVDQVGSLDTGYQGKVGTPKMTFTNNRFQTRLRRAIAIKTLALANFYSAFKNLSKGDQNLEFLQR